MGARVNQNRWGAAAAIWSVLLVFAMGLVPLQVAGAAPDDGAGDKVRQPVQQQLEDKGRADFWVRFADRPDLDRFNGMSDWGARGDAVWEALQETSVTSQAQARARLDQEGVTYQAFSITNAIRVSGGDADLVEGLAASPSVEGV